MSIHLHVSNKLHYLATELASNLHRSKPDPFVPQWVITQTEGMKSWLKIELAKSLGIVANIRFAKPDHIASLIYKEMPGNEKETLNSESIRWVLFSLLAEQDFQEQFPTIKNYCADNALFRFALASEMADLFDQYQIYRDDVIREWNSSNNIADDNWQAQLWKKLKQQLENRASDYAEIATAIQEAVKNKAFIAELKNTVPELHLFGFAVLTPYYLNMFRSLAEHMDVHFYLMNPAPEQYWLEDHSEKQLARLKTRKTPGALQYSGQGNDLLLNLGKIIKETFSLLFKEEQFINLYNPRLQAPADKPATLLAQIQSDIYHNLDLENCQPLAEDAIHDNSIIINGCYSVGREVEVLYNYLVELVEHHDGDISARDMLVLVTDIDNYAPYIKSVFENAPYRFPYTIADETITADNNLFAALHSLLCLDAQTLKTEAVLELLESPHIRLRFGIEETDTIRQSVREAGIILGLQGRKEDDTRLLSWRYGLKRIVYGICMQSDDIYNDGIDTLLPLNNAEGQSVIEQLRLLHFFSQLQSMLEERSQAKTLQDWSAYLTKLTNAMLQLPTDEDNEEFTQLTAMIEQIGELQKYYTQPISFEVFRQSFVAKLQLERHTQRFAGRGITFCSMIPMRSIPFKVVAMLGMNYDAFPRQQHLLSFSLLNQEPRPGDRHVRDNDKHLFLETLLSAKDHLYISYQARNAKDGSALPASVLVDELIDYVARNMKIEAKELHSKWMRLHPLHGFSSKYGTQPGFVSYLNDSTFKSKNVFENDNILINGEENSGFDFSTIQLDGLVRFIQNPARSYLNSQFRISYWDESELLPETEKFSMEIFEQRNIERQIIKGKTTFDNDFIYRQQLLGKLPLKSMGSALLQKVDEDLTKLKVLWQQQCNAQTESSIDIRLALKDGNMLEGQVADIYGNNYLVLNTSSSGVLRDLIGAWTHYLALLANGFTGNLRFISSKTTQVHNIDYQAAMQVLNNEPLDMLEIMVVAFKTGHVDFYPFFPAFAQKDFPFLNQKVADHVESFLMVLAKKQENGYEFNDAAMQKTIELGLFNTQESYQQLKTNIQQVMKPLYNLLEGKDDKKLFA